MKTRFISVVSAILAFLFVAGSAAASPQYVPTGTAFTFQGSLSDAGIPANGVYDFKFNAYDAASAGAQQGATVPQNDVTVTDGRFTVLLDFGSIFDGTALYLEVGVRPGSSTGAYTTLSPRQALTATPYALNALTAPWNGLTGVPAGFADGVDDTGAGAASYQGVVIVAKGGGNFTGVQAALDSITDAAADNPYLVWVAPGVYTEQVTMEPFVDIQGSGEMTTKITYAGFGADNDGTLLGTNNAELRFLTVENTGADLYAIAIFNNAASPRLTHVTAAATGGTSGNYGVFNYQASPTMANVTASASGATANYGVFNETSVLTMTYLTASASGGTSNYGVYNMNDSFVLPNHVQVNNSQITGSTSTIFSDSSSLTQVGASQLSGGPKSGFTVVCAGVYDENYTFYASTCP